MTWRMLTLRTAALVLLLLSIAVCVLLLASAKWSFWFSQGRYFDVDVTVGIVKLSLLRYGEVLGLENQADLYVSAGDSLHLEWWEWRFLTHTHGVDMTFPLWAVLFVLVLPTYIMCRVGWRGRLGDACSQCGYNLTGNVSGRCPERGTPIEGKRGHGRSDPESRGPPNREGGV